ncbi:hypothetical protein L596_024862 [Steinernema carpocapsae]|nr:hypothetical protein L596_024862 [Steinernema carpocapsae]
MDSLGNDLNLVNFFIGKLPIIGRNFDKGIQVQSDVIDHLKGLYRKRQEKIKSGDYSLENGPQDYMDAYIIEVGKRTEDNMGYFRCFSFSRRPDVHQHAGYVGSRAGNDDHDAILGLHRADQQPRRPREAALGTSKSGRSDRDVEERDRSDLPYTMATINEIHRTASIQNFNFFRRSIRETTCAGYTLPRGTVAAELMSAIFRNEEIFPYPERFNPERFLDEKNGKLQQQKMIPFGVGRRACMGEGLAKTEIFLIIANLFKTYKITPATEGGMAPTDPVAEFAVFRRPKPFECHFERVGAC